MPFYTLISTLKGFTDIGNSKYVENFRELVHQPEIYCGVLGFFSKFFTLL